VTNNESNSRFGLIGSATIKPGWTAGYNLEFGIVQDANSAQVNQLTDESSSESFDVRKNELYIESDRLGRVTLGKGSSASDGINEIVLGNSIADSGPDFGNNFFVVGAGDLVNGDFVNNLDGPRNNRIRYDTPSIYGFIVSASWGEDDAWDVALRFKKEWNSIRLAAGIAYAESDPDDPSSDTADFEQISGSASIMHVPTGLYVAGAAGERDFRVLGDDETLTGDFWYVQLGIEKRFLPYGATTIFGEYGQYNDFAVEASEVFDIESSEATLWGFGINQKIDSAAMELYAKVNFYSFDAQAEDNEELFNLDLEDQTFVLIGSRIKF
jgi:predicted porin